MLDVLSPGRGVRPGGATSARDTPLVLLMPDAKTDSGGRRVEILAEGVTLERQVAGVKMRIWLPITLFEGVVLDVRGPASTAGPLVSLRLAHEDPGYDIVLFQADDDRDVTAEWQFWATRFGLPLLVSEPDGSLSQPFPQLGPLMVAEPRPRRIPGDFAKRRPRFLTKRRTGSPKDNPVVHRGREISARD
jgi:hypothetical protein